MANPADMPIFQLMKARMNMLGQRQKTIAENVANVSTPGFVPKDVDEKSFARTMEAIARPSVGAAPRLQMAATQPGHITSPSAAAGGGVRFVKKPDSETTLDGNKVVVEEQMMKVAETRTEFETMVGLYQKSLGLLRIASRSPSR
jgi:flagellar basal-body rod protein FlgB